MLNGSSVVADRPMRPYECLSARRGAPSRPVIIHLFLPQSIVLLNDRSNQVNVFSNTSENRSLRATDTISRMGFVRFVGWLLCVVYSTVPLFWIVIHPNIDSWRRRKQYGKPTYKALLPLWAGMWVVMGAVSRPWRNVLLWHSPLAWIPGALLLSTGVFLYARARRGFSPLQLSGQHEIESDQHRQELVVSGIRRRVRHPIYLGHLCEMLGWSIGTGMAVLFGLTALALGTGAIMIRMEDAELRQRFGDQFDAYQQRVPAIVPRFW